LWEPRHLTTLRANRACGEIALALYNKQRKIHHKRVFLLGFEVLTAVIMKSKLFWGLTPWRFVMEEIRWSEISIVGVNNFRRSTSLVSLEFPESFQTEVVIYIQMI
jgi:hypothetical protein